MKTNGGGGSVDGQQLASLMERLRQASGSTTADRATRDQLLDQLQEAVGLSGKMVTEADLVRRAARLLQEP